MRRLLIATLLLSATTARADAVIRLATVAPDGTAWARELRAMANEIEQKTEGHVRVKWFYGGIAGDELEAGERIKRGQLDGAGAAIWCAQQSSALRTLRVPGLVQNPQQAYYVLTRLKPRIDADFQKAGYVNLAEVVVGTSMPFLRRPVQSLGQLRELKLWRWDIDEVGVRTFKTMGFRMLPLPVHQAAQAYDDQLIDGFYGLPAAALAFQWSTRARYFIDLPMDYLVGCVAITRSLWNKLQPEQREIVQAAAVKMAARAKEAVEQMNAALVDSLFEKQGLKKIPRSPDLVSAFYEAAHEARKRLPEELVPRDVLSQVLEWLADFQIEHGAVRAP